MCWGFSLHTFVCVCEVGLQSKEFCFSEGWIRVLVLLYRVQRNRWSWDCSRLGVCTDEHTLSTHQKHTEHTLSTHWPHTDSPVYLRETFSVSGSTSCIINSMHFSLCNTFNLWSSAKLTHHPELTDTILRKTIVCFSAIQFIWLLLFISDLLYDYSSFFWPWNKFHPQTVLFP